MAGKVGGASSTVLLPLRCKNGESTHSVVSGFTVWVLGTHLSLSLAGRVMVCTVVSPPSSSLCFEGSIIRLFIIRILIALFGLQLLRIYEGLTSIACGTLVFYARRRFRTSESRWHFWNFVILATRWRPGRWLRASRQPVRIYSSMACR